MFEYNEITQRKYILLDDEPYEVISSHVFRKQQRKPVNQTKLKNLITGKVVEKSFHQSDKAKAAEISTKKLIYLYNNKNQHWFSKAGNLKERFSVDSSLVGDGMRFVKENNEVEALYFDLGEEEKLIGIKVPIKVELKVTDSPPGVKGNTAQGGSKNVTVETGASVTVPLFINEGDYIRINTDDGSYAERVSKS
jgi:elongation factor P